MKRSSLFISKMQSRQRNEKIGFVLMATCSVLNVGIVLALIFSLLYGGWSAMSWEFLSEGPKNMMTEGGIWPSIEGTVILSLGAILCAMPIGVASAVYLTEYGIQGKLGTCVRLSIANLAGVPSIIYGLFGLSVFVVLFGMGVSLLAGVLTLAVLSLPIIINTAETALLQIPKDWREASLALGASKRETILKVILPNAMPGILTGSILALSRVAGETAAIMYTAAVFFTPKSVVSWDEPVMALPYHLYVMATSGIAIDQTRAMQNGVGLVLVTLVFLMNFIVIIWRDKKRAQEAK